MSPPLTFGVEFEMAVVCGIEDGEQWHTDKRITSFPDPEISLTRWGVQEEEAWKPIARHMAATLDAAGFDSSVDSSEYTKWDFTSDVSVEAPKVDGPTEYTYASIELRSPALYFTPASLDAVGEVLALLRRTYCINTNVTTGMHVHVGDGRNGWPSHVIRRLFAFVWAFEPQLNTLVPPHRVDGEYTNSMRTYSKFVWDFGEARGRRPTPVEGLVAMGKLPNIRALEMEFLTTTLRVAPNPMHQNGVPNSKPTVEFRHHDGTMDEQRVRVWVTTVVGIMDYLRAVEPVEFTGLLAMTEHEHWEKLGDGRDDEREREMGPILAEDGFTAIDLLKTLSLYRPAKFYMQRGLYRFVRNPDRRRDLGKFYWLEGLADVDYLDGVPLLGEQGDAGPVSSKTDEMTESDVVLAAANELLARKEIFMSRKKGGKD
jgi:hypothetical protein